MGCVVRIREKNLEEFTTEIVVAAGITGNTLLFYSVSVLMEFFL